MNTRICYLYRDSDNYKVHNMCVIHGELTDSQIDQILECCDIYLSGTARAYHTGWNWM